MNLVLPLFFVFGSYQLLEEHPYLPYQKKEEQAAKRYVRVSLSAETLDVCHQLLLNRNEVLGFKSSVSPEKKRGFRI